MAKRRKALAAAGLSVALALACAPAAFAAVDTPTASTDAVENAFDASNQASTELDVMTDVSQLKASVPLKMAIAAKVDGGAITGPDNYKLVNKSLFKIYVTGMTGAAESDWKIVDSDPSALPEPTAAVGDIWLKVNGKVLGTDTVPNLEVPAATVENGAAKPAEYALAVTGATSPLKKALGDTVAKAEKALSITYTISATAPTPSVP